MSIPLYEESILRGFMVLLLNPGIDLTEERMIKCVIPRFLGYNAVESSFLTYKHALIDFFDKHFSSCVGTSTRCEEYFRVLHIKLFDSFVSVIEGKFDHENEFDTIISRMEKWVDVTYEILIETFEEQPFPLEHADLYDNLDICKQAMGTILHHFREHISKIQYGPYVKALPLILYNDWGDDYVFFVNGINKYASLSEIELEMTDSMHNGLLFERYFEGFVNIAVLLANQPEPRISYLAEPKEKIMYFFSEYTKLLRRCRIKDPGILLFAIHHWRYMTEKSIFRITEVERQKYRMSEYPPGSIVHSHIFRLKPGNRRKYDAIMEMRTKCISWIQYMCASYEERIKSGSLRYPWIEELDKVRIDYHGLYTLFINEGPYHYICGISEDVFRDAIESAEINVLMDHLAIPQKDPERGKTAKEPTKETSKAAIRYMVQNIGRQVPEWYKAAASTIKNKDGKPYTVAALQSIHPTIESSRMSEVLSDYMVVKEPRQYQRKE